MDRFGPASHAKYVDLLTLLICPGTEKAGVDTNDWSEVAPAAAAIKAAEAMPLLRTAAEIARRHGWLDGPTTTDPSHSSAVAGQSPSEPKRRRIEPRQAASGEAVAAAAEAASSPALCGRVAQAYVAMRSRLASSRQDDRLDPLINLLEFSN